MERNPREIFTSIFFGSKLDSSLILSLTLLFFLSSSFSREPGGGRGGGGKGSLLNISSLPVSFRKIDINAGATKVTANSIR